MSKEEFKNYIIEKYYSSFDKNSNNNSEKLFLLNIKTIIDVFYICYKEKHLI